MNEKTDKTKINHSDELIDVIRKASNNMSMDEYAQATGITKEYIFRILKGDVEQVDDETYKKLSLFH